MIGIVISVVHPSVSKIDVSQFVRTKPIVKYIRSLSFDSRDNSVIYEANLFTPIYLIKLARGYCFYRSTKKLIYAA